MKKCFQNTSALIALLLCILFLVSLVPIFGVSFYNHSSYADFTYGAGVHAAAMNGAGFFEILEAAANTVQGYYYGWQGTFSAMFLFALQPGAFSEDLYFLSTFILVGSMILATWFFLETILVKWLKQRISHTLILAVLILLVQIQFLPSSSEAFFWYNGAMYYTFFYSLSLVLWALVTRILLAETGTARWLLAVPTALLAFFIGGGNYSTALFVGCSFVLILFFQILLKKPGIPQVAVSALLFFAAFLISMAAPGNAIRGGQLTGMSPVRAILGSFIEAVLYTGNWTLLPQLLPLLMGAPLLYKAASVCKWSFRYPVLAIGVAFGLFACMFTPPLYAMSMEGSARQINIYYYTFIVMLCFDIFYLSGWICKRHPGLIDLSGVFRLIRTYALPILLVFAVLFAASCLTYRFIWPITTLDCIEAWQNGSIQEFDRVTREHREQMRSTEGECVLTTPIPRVRVFVETGYTEDPEHFVNNACANYYGCDSVIYLPEN